LGNINKVLAPAETLQVAIAGILKNESKVSNKPKILPGLKISKGIALSLAETKTSADLFNIRNKGILLYVNSFFSVAGKFGSAIDNNSLAIG
jgi:hypothetical protein